MNDLAVIDSIDLSSRHIQFGVMSPQNMVKIGELEVTQRDLYQPESRTPVKGGVLDLRMVCFHVIHLLLSLFTHVIYYRVHPISSLPVRLVAKACKTVLVIGAI